jgi:hypothetical protein
MCKTHPLRRVLLFVWVPVCGPCPLRGFLHGQAFKIPLKPRLLLFDRDQHSAPFAGNLGISLLMADLPMPTGARQPTRAVDPQPRKPETGVDAVEFSNRRVRLRTRNWYPSLRSTLPLLGQDGEVLLPAGEGSDFLVASTLEIHRKPQGPDEQPGNTRSDVLRNLAPTLRSKFLDLGVVRQDFDLNGRAIHKAILWLDYRDGLWGTASTPR